MDLLVKMNLLTKKNKKKKQTKKRVGIVFFVLLIMWLAIALSGCSGRGASSGEEKLNPSDLKAVTIQEKSYSSFPSYVIGGEIPTANTEAGQSSVTTYSNGEVGYTVVFAKAALGLGTGALEITIKIRPK